MQFPIIFMRGLFLFLSLGPSLTYGCTFHVRQEDSASTDSNVIPTDPSLGPPYMTTGTDDPSPPATDGYFMNHMCLNVRNASASIAFYNAAFGFRHLFTLQVSEHFSIRSLTRLQYLAHAQGGRNSSAYQTVAEMSRNQRNSQGLLELLSTDTPGWDLPVVPTTFSHLGMTVPDLAATQIHLEDIGAKIRKAAYAEFRLEDGFAVASGLQAARDRGEIGVEEWALIGEVLKPVNEAFIFVEDPDGNVIEVQEQS